jgi:NAD(P)-dependent dehydrogenase (short-subunit alcohol dehydrogenase family)
MSPTPTAVVYSATKGAVDTITRVLAKELVPKKNRVNAINPGGVETEGTHSTGIIGSEACASGKAGGSFAVQPGVLLHPRLSLLGARSALPDLRRNRN